jgi:hypothetical protein
MSAPHLRTIRCNGYGAARMCKCGMLIHSPGCLGTAATILTAEIPGGNRVFAEWTLELSKALHLFFDVMSHSSIVGARSRYDSELKLCPASSWA